MPLGYPLAVIDLTTTSGLGLNGTLPCQDVQRATALEELVLWGNAIEGNLCSEFASLPFMSECKVLHPSSLVFVLMVLRSCTCTHTCPSTLPCFHQFFDFSPAWPLCQSLSTNLDHIDLEGNMISGTLPTELGTMARMSK